MSVPQPLRNDRAPQRKYGGPADLDHLVGKVMAEFGTIDVLASAAVRYHTSSLLELDEESWDTLTDTNLKGYWLTCKAVAPIMKERRRGDPFADEGDFLGLLQANSGQESPPSRGDPEH